MCSMHGTLTMGIIGLGWSLVSGLRRVPCPPAMITAFIGPRPRQPCPSFVRSPPRARSQEPPRTCSLPTFSGRSPVVASTSCSNHILPARRFPRTRPLAAALNPDPDAHAPEPVAPSQAVLHVAQVALRQVLGPVRKEREPRRVAPGLGRVADLHALRRCDPPHQLVHELGDLVRRDAQPVRSAYPNREG